MSAYAELQQQEITQESYGYRATTHQKFVGTGYFDLMAQVCFFTKKCVLSDVYSQVHASSGTSFM